MKNKTIVLMTIVSLISFGMFNSFSSYENEEIKVYIDNRLIEFDSEPEVKNSRTMVPLRQIFEEFDMTVDWDSVLSKVRAYKKNLNIELYIGSDRPIVNGQTVEIDAKAYVVNGRTMVPLRFIAESTGAEVKWVESSKSVYITTVSVNTNSMTDSSDNESISQDLTYKIVDTGVTDFFTDSKKVSSLSSTSSFYGQDANYDGNQASYNDNNDGTVSDLVTGLMWQQTMNAKMTYDEALSYANNSKLGGYSDWRIPNIKELFSLILYTGTSGGEVAKELYIDTKYFDQAIGDTSIGEREIDAQVWSSSKYVSTTMKGDGTIFGVNFIDGRIKGYAEFNKRERSDNEMYFRLVRGNTSYGENVFIDNGDGTISDTATGLMWQMADDGNTRDWQEAIKYAEDLELANHTDWRLPNVKELQSIVDYTKSVQTSNSPAINDLFVLSEMKDPNGDKNYGFYWSSTTHQDGMNTADSASYVAFGKAQGEMFGELLDVHGAGSVRSDPKSGTKSNYPSYFGPQGDVRYVYNYVLAVRDIDK